MDPTEESADEFQTHLLGGTGLCSVLVGAELTACGMFCLAEPGRATLPVTDLVPASSHLTASFKFLGGRGWGPVLVFGDPSHGRGR